MKQGEELIGKRIVKVEYHGDYYYPFKIQLEDGTVVSSGGWG